MRALADSGRPRSGYFDDFDLLAEKVDALCADPSITGCYWTLNPCHPDLLARRPNAIGPARQTTTDAGILGRRWLLVDADPVRPSGISATDAEKAAALARADAVAGALGPTAGPRPSRPTRGTARTCSTGSTCRTTPTPRPWSGGASRRSRRGSLTTP